ncbi:hypothetical protein AB3S75_032702 [Citrus x aurantiifolia]
MISLALVNCSTLRSPYRTVKLDPQESGMSKSVMIGIVLGSIACLITESLATAVLFDVKNTKYKNEVSRRQSIWRIPIKADSVKRFSFIELEEATSLFLFDHSSWSMRPWKGLQRHFSYGTIVALSGHNNDHCMFRENFKLKKNFKVVYIIATSSWILR